MLIFVGIKHTIVALDDETGEEEWRIKLGGSDYVTVMWDGEALIAANIGEVWRLDPETGGILWHNELKGLGRGIVSLASHRRPTDSTTNESSAMKRQRDQEAAAAAAAG